VSAIKQDATKYEMLKKNGQPTQKGKNWLKKYSL
jgi:hypothetical protein